MQALKENGKDATEADENKDSEGTSKTVPFKKRRRKLYLLVAIVAILTFAIGMTSIGEVPLVTEIKNQILGTSKMVKTNSAREGDDTVVESAGSEATAIDEIENEFGMQIVSLGYLPKGFDFSSYEIDKTLNKASLFYQNQNSILEYRISFSPTEQATGYQAEDNLLNEQTVEVGEAFINLKCYGMGDGEADLYVAQFEYQNVYYTLTGNLSETEIKGILEKFYFF